MSTAEDARRRSTCLHPHTHASEAGEAVTRRRSTRLHPQIQASDDARRRHLQANASEEGAGLALRRSARLRPSAHASEEASGVTRRSRGSSSAPLEDDDLLWEILLRLPPEPSSLPRASAVCKRWRRAVTDPRFHRRFCQHHRKPPLLGFFVQDGDGLVFKSAMGPPDRIPPRRFDLRHHDMNTFSFLGVQVLGCRHGRLLLMCPLQRELIVIAPITGEEHRVQLPPEFNEEQRYVNGEVLCAAADHNHVHGSCHSSPFKVVLHCMGSYLIGPQLALARVYYSKTGIWGDLISTPTPCVLHDAGTHGSLVGNALYWLCGDYILQFDLEGQSLAFIRVPPRIYAADCEIIGIADGTVGLATWSRYCYNIQMWQRKVNCQGVAQWVLWKTIDMHNIHGIPPVVQGERPDLSCGLRYAEDTDDIFLCLGTGVYVLHLTSMQSKKLCEAPNVNGYFSFKSFYMPAQAQPLLVDGMELKREDSALVC